MARSGVILGLIGIAALAASACETGAYQSSDPNSFVSMSSYQTPSLAAEVSPSNPPKEVPRVGDCALLEGPANRAKFAPMPCASDRSNYKVIAISEWPNQCPVDVDQVYNRIEERGAFTACLDINWKIDVCVANIDSIAVPCNSELARDEFIPRKVVRVDPNNYNARPPCKNGKSYRDRGFVVCGDWGGRKQ